MQAMSTPTPQPGPDLHDLAATLRLAAAAYYDGQHETMTDREYDDGIEQLRIAVAADPSLAGQFDDLLSKVAAGQSKGGDVEHPSRMGSLEKADGIGALDAFVLAVDGPVAVEPKLDGLAIRARYDDEGRLVLVATRGDGTRGEDITKAARALRIVGLPLRVDPFYGVREVRGEVFVRDGDFERAQSVRASLGGGAFVNSRNAAAGILRKGDKAYVGILSFAAYGAAQTRPPASGRYSDAMTVVADAGIGTAGGLLDFLGAVTDLGSAGVDAVRQRVDALGQARADLGFPIDGIVVKADALADRQRLGDGERAPKWALAYKYEAETATTTVVDITTTVGKTGRLGIRIEVEPVFVGGTTVTYATGHNVAWMAERDVRVGDTVTIKRANDVIPYVESVDLTARPSDSTPWTPPDTDPAGQPWDKSTLLWRSTSPELSVLGKIVYAVSRDCLDVEGIGVEIATALVESGLVADVADLFTLQRIDLATLTLAEGRQVGDKVAAKIRRELDEATDAPWNRVITALGIRMTGRTMGRRLAAAFPDVQALRAASVADLAAVDGIGEVKASVIREGLDDLVARGVLDRLAAAGVNMGAARPQGEGSGPLDGMTVVVSGSVPGYSRTTIAEAIEAAGGKASSSVSASTSLLVSDPSTSSKYVKAQQLGVRIVTPADFLGMLG